MVKVTQNFLQCVYSFTDVKLPVSVGKPKENKTHNNCKFAYLIDCLTSYSRYTVSYL